MEFCKFVEEIYAENDPWMNRPEIKKWLMKDMRSFPFPGFS